MLSDLSRQEVVVSVHDEYRVDGENSVQPTLHANNLNLFSGICFCRLNKVESS